MPAAFDVSWHWRAWRARARWLATHQRVEQWLLSLDLNAAGVGAQGQGPALILLGGSAGWMTALMLATTAYGARLKVTLVESPHVPIIGVGEGSTPWLRNRLLANLRGQVVHACRVRLTGLSGLRNRFESGTRDLMFQLSALAGNGSINLARSFARRMARQFLEPLSQMMHTAQVWMRHHPGPVRYANDQEAQGLLGRDGLRQDNTVT